MEGGVEDGKGNATFYEEGTWTPGITIGGSEPSYSDQQGKYVYVGNLTYVEARIALSSKDSLTGKCYIIGWPRTTGIGRNAAGVWYITGINISNPIHIRLGLSSSSVRKRVSNGLSDLDSSDFTDGFTIEFGGWYLK